jgi:hypothetical protein
MPDTIFNMHSGFKHFFCLLILYFGMSYSFAFVMGEDDRKEVTVSETKQPGIRQTGFIRISDEEFVTGVVTGENCDVVITAGHAAIHWRTVERKGWQKGELRGSGRLMFYVDPKDVNNGIMMDLVKSGYEEPVNLGEDEYDWSIFRLGSPAMKTCSNLKIAEKQLRCEGKVIMPAFHFDKRDKKLIDHVCSIKDSVNNGVLVHDCDTKDGSSGAPVFCMTNNLMTLIGINTSGLAQKTYEDPGVYGQAGLEYHSRKHKNFAVSIHNEFYRVLKKELEASACRARVFADKTAIIID